MSNDYSTSGHYSAARFSPSARAAGQWADYHTAVEVDMDNPVSILTALLVGHGYRWVRFDDKIGQRRTQAVEVVSPGRFRKWIRLVLDEGKTPDAEAPLGARLFARAVDYMRADMGDQAIREVLQGFVDAMENTEPAVDIAAAREVQAMSISREVWRQQALGAFPHQWTSRDDF